MRKTGIPGDAFGQGHAVSDRDILEQLLGAFMRVEEANLEVEHRFASHAEEEMARFDNAGVHRAHGNLEDAFAFHDSELVAFSLEGGQNRFQIEILSQRIDFGPVVVERATAGIRVAFELQAEEVLDFTFLPVGRGQRV